MKNYALQFLAFSLRSASLLARFLLVVVVARTLSPENFGFYMLYVAALQIGTAAASMDVYAETTRQYLKVSDQRRYILNRHFSFLGVTGILIGPLGALIFFAYDGQFSIILYLVFPLFFLTELFANDIIRLLVPLGHPFAASLVLFLRQLLPLAITLAFEELVGFDLSLLDAILITFGASVPVIGAVLIIFRLRGYFDSMLFIELHWVRTTVQKSLILFAASMVFRALFGIDRFLVASTTGLATSGIYALYVSFGLGIVSVLEAGISAWKYPSMVRSILQRDFTSVMVQLRSFLVSNLISSILMCSVAYFVIQYIVVTFLEPFYQSGLIHLHWILFGAFVISASLPFHYILFGLRKDRSLLAIYLCAAAAVMLYAVSVLKGGGVSEAFGVFTTAALVIAIGRPAFAIGYLRSIHRGGLL